VKDVKVWILHGENFVVIDNCRLLTNPAKRGNAAGLELFIIE